MSSYNDNNLESFFLQNLMGRLQLRPPYLSTNSFLTQSLEDFIHDINSVPDEDKTPLAKEESKLEKEVIRIIHSGKAETLKPNSGQCVTIGDHHICVAFREETDSDYRVWEWHGHIMLFDEENGYTPEYFYGNYFERSPVKFAPDVKEKEEEEEEEIEEKKGNLGLRELIDGRDSISGRILRRNGNAGSSK